jgi:hypothetical protein
MIPRRRAALAALVFALAVAAVAGRTLANLNVAGRPEIPRFGMQDFRDGIYYPVVALLDGHNPYDVLDYTGRYPVGQKFPLFSPMTLLVYLPFAFLPQDLAAVLFLLLNLALTLVLAALLLTSSGVERTAPGVLGLATVVVLSHPGQMGLFIGQGVIYFAIGLVLAFTCARGRPWLAGAGLALTCLKPTVGVPAALLLALRGDRYPLTLGIGLASALALAVVPFLVAAAGGVGPFVASLVDNYGRWGHDAAIKVTESVHRVDAFLLVGRALGRPLTAAEDALVVAVVFALAAWAVRRAVRVEDAERRPLSTSVMVTAILIGSYHQAYDAVFLSLPVVLAASGAWGRSEGARVGRVLLLVGAGVIALNYLSTHALIGGLGLTGSTWTAVTSANALAMLAAFLGCLTAALGAGRPGAAGIVATPRGDSTAAA